MKQHFTDTINSPIRIQFSKQIAIKSIRGPYRMYLWRHRGYKIQIKAHDYDAKFITLYHQYFESYPHAFIRAMYYRIYALYHNIRYRRYHV